MALNVERMHEFLRLDEKIKALEAQIKDMKSEKAALDPEIISDLAEAQILGMIIGNRQLSYEQKTTLNVHSKSKLMKFLEKNHPEFIKKDIDEKALQEFLLNKVQEDEEAQPDSETEETPVPDTLPPEYDGLASIFKFNKLKITKAKKS